MRKLLAVMLGTLLIVFSCTGCIFSPDPSYGLETYELKQDVQQQNYMQKYVQEQEQLLKMLEGISEYSMVEHNSKTGETNVIDFGPSIGDFGMSTTGAPTSSESGIDPHIVIWPDDRVEVSNVRQHPYKTIVFLRIKNADGKTTLGSGVMVGNSTILTAGHVVKDGKHGGWAEEIRVYPGGKNSGYASAVATDFACSTQWASSYSEEYDYGIINLDRPLSVGYLNMTALSDSQLEGKVFQNYGFPADKTEGTMWACPGKVWVAESRVFLHDADTEGGSSGSPMVDANNNIIGIHVAWENIDYNRAIRITNTVIAYVNNYL